MTIRPIAVVTVCRNPGALLADAIGSVAGVGDPRLLHIVIDGASTDGTPAYLRARSAALFHWISESDSGIYDAMNKGWAAAPPDAWVIYIGADDRLLGVPSAGELEDLEAKGADIVYGTTMLGADTFDSFFDGGIRYGNRLHHQSMMVRKSIHPAPPFDTAYRVYGDWEFNIRLWRAGANAVRTLNLRAFADPGGVSRSGPLWEAFRISSRHFGWRAGAIAAGSLARHRFGRTAFGSRLKRVIKGFTVGNRRNPD